MCGAAIARRITAIILDSSNCDYSDTCMPGKWIFNTPGPIALVYSWQNSPADLFSICIPVFTVLPDASLLVSHLAVDE